MDDRTHVWITIAVCGVIVLAFRASFVVFGNPERFPVWLRSALTYVPAAVIAALVVPGLVLLPLTQQLSVSHPRFFAGLVALVVAWRTRSMGATMAVGMGSLWLIEWLFST
jgi:branched-subunit amino acid transport protein